MRVSKYIGLAQHLAGCTRSPVTMTFDEVAELVPGGLPNSAYRHAAWWSNETGRHVQAQGWLGPGWRTESLDLEGRTVTFRRQ